MILSVKNTICFHYFNVKGQVYTKSISRSFSTWVASLGWRVQRLDLQQVGVSWASLSCMQFYWWRADGPVVRRTGMLFSVPAHFARGSFLHISFSSFSEVQLCWRYTRAASSSASCVLFLQHLSIQTQNCSFSFPPSTYVKSVMSSWASRSSCWVWC